MSLFLIRYAAKCTELNPPAGLMKEYIVKGVKKLLTFYEDYDKLKKENSEESFDTFNCHKLYNYTEGQNLDKNNLFYKEIYKNLRDLLDSQYQWKKKRIR